MGGGEGWTGVRGLADDVRYYGGWIRNEAQKRIGDLYPKAQLKEQGGSQAIVIAWLWARTVKCPNPACGARMPLVRSFWLSTKAGKKAWVEPIVDRAAKMVRFEVRTDQGEPPDGTVNRQGATCIICDTAVPFAHVRAEGMAHRMSRQLLATVVEGQRGRKYMSPSEDQAHIGDSAKPSWYPDGELPKKHRNFQTPAYGMSNLSDLFTPRQLVALTTFSNLVGEAQERARHDAVVAGLLDDGVPLAEGGTGAMAYAQAIATYLAFAVDKATARNTTLCSWQIGLDRMRDTFGRQALPMVWDFAETNPLAGAGGDIRGCVYSLCETLDKLSPGRDSLAYQADAAKITKLPYQAMISTDPPYYDNIDYADLSDFFYVWLRRMLGKIYPDLFGTMLVPKAQELVATPNRFDGSKGGLWPI